MHTDHLLRRAFADPALAPRRRFGDLPSALVIRLATSTIAQLDAIALRILDANSLDEVFAD